MSLIVRPRLPGLVAVFALWLVLAPAPARSGEAASTALVACKLPGQIMTGGGHARMAAGQIVQVSAAQCRQRGGEYTVDETPPPAASPAPVVDAADARIVSCLLPAQTRQLGEKARYRTGRRIERMRLADCRAKGGSIYTPRKAPVRRKH